MSGPQVLTIVHFVGWGFIFLWIMATGFKQGMWNNALMLFNWVLASFIALPLGGVASNLLAAAVKPAPDDIYTAFAIMAGMFWLVYLIAFLVIQTLTESLSKVKLSFHPVVETLGSLFFSFSTFLVIAAATLPLFGLVRLHAL